MRVGCQAHSFVLVTVISHIAERNDEMAGAKVTEAVFEIAEPFARENDCFVDEVEFKKEGSDYVLRVIVDVDDSAGGVSIDQCENVSRALSDALDEADLIEQAYMLEVSSPGIDRELKKESHFERFMGRDVDVKFYKPHMGSKMHTGKLVAYADKTVTVEINGEPLTFAQGDAASIRLAIVW